MRTSKQLKALPSKFGNASGRQLLATCADAGVTRLYSEDMQHGADIDGVKIVNPSKT